MVPVSKRVVLSLVLLLILLGRGGTAVGHAADPFPNVILTTHEGRRVRFYDDLIKDKIVAINLIYTRCRYACPLETAKLAQVQRLLGERMGHGVFFYSITIDPEHDTPAVLKEYAEQYRAGPGWLFLTGARADVELIGTRLGLYATDSRSNADGHLPYLLVGNAATGQWMRNSALDHPQFIARTIGDWLSNWQFSATVASTTTSVPRLTLDTGQYTFANRCAVCHTIGGGDRIGPDLHGITSIRDRTWLARMIREPDKLLGAGDPTALALSLKYRQVRMPNLGLTQAEAAALIDYIDARSRAVPANLSDANARARAPGENDTDLTPIIAAYLRIHRALYADTLRGVPAQARLIAAACARARAPDESISSAAAALVRGSDLATTRVAFEKLGIAIVTAVAQGKARLTKGVRTAYCPMLRKYWLQSRDQIRNPFYGSRMPDCGHFVRNDSVVSLDMPKR